MGEHMIQSETLLSFLLTSFVIELTPGPNMAYLAVLSLAHGRWAGFAAAAGVALGLLIVGLGAAFGLAAIIANSQLLYELLRWTGVVYLLWLAYDGWRDATETSPGRTDPQDTAGTFFTRGLITNILNPKAAIFYIAVLPTFVVPDRNILGQTVALSMIYVAVATTVHVIIVSLAATARGYLEDASAMRPVRRILSMALAAVAIWFAVSTAR